MSFPARPRYRSARWRSLGPRVLATPRDGAYRPAVWGRLVRGTDTASGNRARHRATVTWGSISADWAGVIVTAAGGLVALALLIFEMRTARSERHRREEAEVKAVRDLSLERARRVVAWIEPIMWQVNRQGVVAQLPGGWKLVVSNDTDDTISNWRATVIDPAPDGVDRSLLEAAVVEHGVIPPRSRFEADLRTDDASEQVPPAHNDLRAIAVLWWVDRAAVFWHSRGATGPIRVPAEEGRWSVSHHGLSAQPGGRREIHRQGFSATRLN